MGRIRLTRLLRQLDYLACFIMPAKGSNKCNVALGEVVGNHSWRVEASQLRKAGEDVHYQAGSDRCSSKSRLLDNWKKRKQVTDARKTSSITTGFWRFKMQKMTSRWLKPYVTIESRFETTSRRGCSSTGSNQICSGIFGRWQHKMRTSQAPFPNDEILLERGFVGAKSSRAKSIRKYTCNLASVSALSSDTVKTSEATFNWLKKHVWQILKWLNTKEAEWQQNKQR